MVVVAEAGGGWGLRSSVQAKLGRISATAEYSQINDFASQALGRNERDSGYDARLRLDNIPMPDKRFWQPAALHRACS